MDMHDYSSHGSLRSRNRLRFSWWESTGDQRQSSLLLNLMRWGLGGREAGVLCRWKGFSGSRSPESSQCLEGASLAFFLSQ